MTNIIEIVDNLNKDGHHIDVAIIDGKVLVGYNGDMFDVTNISFAQQIQLISSLIAKEFFKL